MKRIVRRRTEITIETHEIRTVRSDTADVVAYGEDENADRQAVRTVVRSITDGKSKRDVAEGAPDAGAESN